MTNEKTPVIQPATMANASNGNQERNMTERVLIVEDDRDIVEILALYLSGAGYEVEAAPDGIEGVDALRERGASVVLVDLMMPHMNGFDFIKEARSFSNAPIIVVSARNQPSDKALGLDLGADGYITKPFDPTEVLAYVRAMIRRNGMASHEDTAAAATVLRVGDVELDTEQLVVRKRGEAVVLTASEFKIVMRMMSSSGRVFTKAQLYEAVSGESYDDGGDTIMVHISNIRSKIEDDPSDPQLIETVRGLGYRFAR